MTCMICGKEAVVTVDAPVSLHGAAAPAGRKAYDPLKLQLCAEHVEEYHGEPAPGPEKWVPEAIAEQEEYMKRERSCSNSRDPDAPGILGTSHSWETFSLAPGGGKYEACWRCGVTKTPEDYHLKEGR